MSDAKTHLDLFSGVGGFTLAAQRAGFRTIGFSEIDPYACKILARHWPDVPNFGDIRKCRGIRADLITGGFPCQPFSLAGKRRGAEDDRHLWPEMRRVIAESGAAWVLAENVPGIIRMELDGVLSDLESLGYACWPLVIPACAVDAPHRRDRVWIVAHASKQPERESADTPNTITTCRETRNESRDGGASLADAASLNAGPRRPRRSKTRSEAPIRSADVSDANGEQARRAAIARSECCEWQPEPELGRVAHGTPNRSHRLKGLGNAIVPQVACEILRCMLVAGNGPNATNCSFAIFSSQENTREWERGNRDGKS